MPKPNTQIEPQNFASTRSNGSTGAPASVGSGWGGGGFGNPSSASGFGNYDQGALGAGFGQPDSGQANSSRNDLSRSLGGGQVSNSGMEDVITIQMLPEKEGMFLFQHRNYEVKSARKATSVIRRYSDFVWLVDCLQKKFPFRQIPLLPPKRVAGTLNRWKAYLKNAHIYFFLKSMALTYQRIRIPSWINVAEASSALLMLLCVIRY